ncbi:FkbM family methyltransferase [Microbaculum marinum]|uniref:FkbM family methyltransferase n=1 Tax=Microbaculum marinum TaxID=1764581 RepID=A0AAW9RQD6_9HYPH
MTQASVTHQPASSGGSEAPPFGAYTPTPLQARLIDFARRQPDSWLGKRLAFLARRAVMMQLRHPLDVEVFGQRMRLNPFNNVSEKRILFTPQYFDLQEREILRDHIVDGFVFVDIGANIGGYALYVAGHAGRGARILAIEPQPVVFDRLVQNISLNPSGAIKAIACALADKEGEMTLFLSARNKGESSVKYVATPGSEDQSVQVPARTLINLLREEGIDRIDALKIDVEGAEDLILVPFLEDAPESLLPSLMIIENARDRWQTDCIALLQRMGYRQVAQTRLNVVLERGETAGAQPENGTAREISTPSSVTEHP